MKDHEFYDPQDHPSMDQKKIMWNIIGDTLPKKRTSDIHLHWRSFWIGNAAAVLLIFAGIGVFNTTQNFTSNSGSTEDKMYQTLNTATKQLQEITPLLIQQAQDQNKASIESTASAIEEIDRLILEIKNDISINGASPAKELSLKRLYATKLDFYKEILLNQEDQS